MKELSIEEKAKAYDKVREKIAIRFGSNVVDEIFSQFEMSEDERIRKHIISVLEDAWQTCKTIDYDSSKIQEDITWLKKQESVGEIVERCKNSWYNEGKIAEMAEGLTDDEKYQQGWHDALEKQGEQKPQRMISAEAKEAMYNKPTDKVEPKFNIGDTIIKKNNSDINKFGQFTITDITGGKYWYNDRIICDISEQYEWELVEQKPISFDTSTPVSYDDIPFGAKDYELHEFTYSIPEGFHAEIEGGKVIIKRGEQNPTWSEEDETGWTNTMIMIKEVASNHYTKDSIKMVIDWLKSLKERIGG